MNDTAALLTRYEAIREHAELELETVGRGDLEALAALSDRWQELTSYLPSRPPTAAATLLGAARLAHDRTRAELIRRREALLLDISTSTRARRAANGYAGALPRRGQLDRSA